MNRITSLSYRAYLQSDLFSNGLRHQVSITVFRRTKKTVLAYSSVAKICIFFALLALNTLVLVILAALVIGLRNCVLGLTEQFSNRQATVADFTLRLLLSACIAYMIGLFAKFALYNTYRGVFIVSTLRGALHA